MTSKFFGIAVGLVGFTVGLHAQVLEVVVAGSSAQFLQLGLAAGTGISASPAGLGATCVWTQGTGTGTTPLNVTDTFTPTGGSPITRSESGNAWVAWTPAGASCTTVNGNTKIYAMVQTDSVIGNRLYFNGGKLGSVSGATPTGTTSGLLFPGSEQSTLPSGVWNKLNGVALTAAATDIRPEDAKFTMERGLTSCGSSVSGSQYLGLGYSNGDAIFSAFGTSPSSFHVLDFNLPTDGSYTVIPLGAVPVVVAVNTTNTTNGFGSLAFGGSTPANITRQTLAKFLDGSYGYTGDISAATAGTGANATPLIREPLSGTYNTMEYSVPDTTNLGGAGNLNTSQDVGTNQPTGQQNCSTTTPGAPAGFNATLGGYQMIIATNDNASANRKRVIGTGQSITELNSVQDAIQYAFWSTANYAPAAANAKYLTVDGYDPLYNRPAGSSACTVGSTTVPYSTISNTLPTAGNTYLACVQFTDLQNGNYPIWSLLRLVTTSTTTSNNYIAANKLAFTAQNFISTTNHPDFVPFSNNGTTGIPLLQVLHSHFAPPGVTFRSWDPTVNPTGDPSNGANAFGGTTGGAAPNCTMVEAGGDVGGAILTVSSDNTYCGTHTQAGQINQRQ
jgi:hypothetical protein